jgi:hypothetical protein
MVVTKRPSLVKGKEYSISGIPDRKTYFGRGRRGEHIFVQQVAFAPFEECVPKEPLVAVSAYHADVEVNDLDCKVKNERAAWFSTVGPRRRGEPVRKYSWVYRPALKMLNRTGSFVNTGTREHWLQERQWSPLG